VSDPWEYRPAADIELSPREQLCSLRREPGLVSTGLHVLWRSMTRGYLKVGHRLRVVGKTHLPKAPPVVVVANHASHLDALVLCSALPLPWRDRVFPIAAGDTFFASRGRAIFAATMLNALPMWRKRRAVRQDLGTLRARLTDDALAFVLFPEGTRSRTGELGSFKGGLGALVAETSVPVVPAWIEGAYKALPPGRRVPRPSRIEVRFGPPLRFEDTSNSKEGWREIRDRIRAAVGELGRGHEDAADRDPR